MQAIDIVPTWREGDIFLCSHPKSGRTWIKQFLAQYLSLTFSLGYREDFDLIDLMRIVPSEWALRLQPESPKRSYLKNPAVPRVRFSHYGFHRIFIGRPVIWLTRGVEDTLVSMWHDGGRQGKIGDFVREKVGGYIDWMTGWIAGIPQASRWLHVTYEELSAGAQKGFRDILEFIGLPFDSPHFFTATYRASFDKMKKDEEGTTVERVRRGIVGGYRDELSPGDIKFIRNAVRAGGDALCFYCGVSKEESDD